MEIGLVLLFITCCILAETDPITLDNGAIRVVVDPDLFSVNFVGCSGGKNFVEPLPVSPEVRARTGWVDPGGLQTDVIPYTASDAAIRRGPAKVIEQRADYVAMLGPPSESTGMRIKKEVQLVGREPTARFRVSAMRVTGEVTETTIRNTVRLPRGSTVRLMREDGEIHVLAGADSVAPAVVKSRTYWLIPVPPTASMNGVILGAFVPRLMVVNASGTWTRRLVNMPGTADDVPNGSTFLCVLDDASGTYGAALQGSAEKTAKEDLLVLEEEWTVERRGR
jgi:hypothetical protein